MNYYKVLNKQTFRHGEYAIVPIRMKDRYNIMRWRNDQMYHLRQKEALTVSEQDLYFENVISKLFELEDPDQILFSFLENEKCVGYGGLVHINWTDRNAEISFLIETKLEKIFFKQFWLIFLFMIQEVAFRELKLHKIYTYAFDLRKHLYEILENAGFKREATLYEHCLFENNYINVVIHSKFRKIIKLRAANLGDQDLTYQWAIDPIIRKYALNKSEITAEEHSNWFKKKLEDKSCIFLIGEYEMQQIGVFRIDVKKGGKAIVSYLLDRTFHGRGLGSLLLREGIEHVKKDNRVKSLIAQVVDANLPSVHIIEKLNFTLIKDERGLKTYQLLL